MVRYDILCHIIDDGKLLLLKKSAGLFGGGKWNGLGGKMRPTESPEQACIREIYEESGLQVSNLKRHGALKFWFGNTNEPAILCYVFSTKSFKGQIREGQEGFLHWTSFDDVPYEEMWEDDRHWLPLLIEGKSFNGEFRFDKEGTKLISYKIEVPE